jgi:hypothetical protein
VRGEMNRAMIDRRLPQPSKLRVRIRSAQEGVRGRADRRQGFGLRSITKCHRCFPFAHVDYGTMYKTYPCGNEHTQCKSHLTMRRVCWYSLERQ